MATIVLFLYVWGLMSGVGSASEALFVSRTTALIAAGSFAISVACYLWTPLKFTFASAAFVYILLVVTTGTLILQSGGISSPFAALWLVPGVFAGIFNWWGIGLALVLANSFILYTFFGGSATPTDIVVGFLTATLPVLVSFLLWSERSPLDSSQEKQVSKLSKKLEREASKSDAIVQAIGDGVIAVKQTGEITLLNTSAQKMTGWPAEDGVGVHYRSVLKLETEKGDEVTEKDDPILRVLNTRQMVRENNLIVLTKSGKKITSSFTITPLEGEKGGALAVFRDVTKERKKEREQTEFISTASHEMRTPVASIEGYLGLALNPATAQIDDRARDFIQKAHESTQHLGHLFQDLLNVTKAEDGRIENNPEVIDMTNFARDILESLTPQANEKGLDLLFRPDGTKTTTGTTVVAPVLYARADKNHLREVVANLIENAIKYTPDGKVEVDLDSSKNYVRVIIKDSGLGIPEEDLPHLFQKFYRVDNSDTREIGGTGLGLYLCRRLVESMNGRIWVESELKQGSQFYVEIPRLEHAEATRLLEETKRAAAQKGETPTPVPSRFPTSAKPTQTPAPAPTPKPTPAPAATQPLAQTPSIAAAVKPAEAAAQPAQLPPVQTPQPTPVQTPLPMPTVPPSLTPAPVATVAPTQTPAPTPTQTPKPRPTAPVKPLKPIPQPVPASESSIEDIVAASSAAQQLQELQARRAAQTLPPRASAPITTERTASTRNSQQKP